MDFALLQRALAISDRIHEPVTKNGVTWELHMPAGTIMNPRFGRGVGRPPGPAVARFGKYPESCEDRGRDEIGCYTQAGDSAIWTGHYLAAEAFRYATTRDPEALEYARTALNGIRGLVDVTGNDMLARAFVYDDFPYKESILAEESRNCPDCPGDTELGGRAVRWIGRTSGDQYSGVFFGLFWAHRLIDVESVRQEVAALTSRMAHALLDNRPLRSEVFYIPTGGECPRWEFIFPFPIRTPGPCCPVMLDEDQYLSIFRIASAQNPKDRELERAFRDLRMLDGAELALEVGGNLLDFDGSYYKFNRLAINLPSLILLEHDSFLWRVIYLAPWDVLWRFLRDEDNAFFTMQNYALRQELGKSGYDTWPGAALDAKVAAKVPEMLKQWMTRPSRNVCIPNDQDAMGRVRTKWGSNDRHKARSLPPIPVHLRSSTDFLWQRSPYQLSLGVDNSCGDGTIEAPGIDYILPYWMARYYGILEGGVAPSSEGDWAF